MLVNDFGSINIDADLVVGVENEGNVISLANGCSSSGPNRIAERLDPSAPVLKLKHSQSTKPQW